MDVENNGKAYEQMDDLGVPLFLETPTFDILVKDFGSLSSKFIEYNELPNVSDVPFVLRSCARNNKCKKRKKNSELLKGAKFNTTDHSIAICTCDPNIEFGNLEEHQTSRCYASCVGAYLDFRALKIMDFDVIPSRIWFMNFD